MFGAPWKIESPMDLEKQKARPRLKSGLPAALAALVLAGCASAPRQDAAPSPSGATVTARPGPAPSGERDGSEAQPPPDLAAVPDAEPRVEPIRNGGPNKPYEVLGRAYVPVAADRPFVERGLASWYGKKFHGRRTASGEVYNMYAMTAAHPTLPIPSYARIRNPANGAEVVVRVNDRGPFVGGRIVDLSYTAAYKLDLLRGVAPVEVERITHEQIRSGAWRQSSPPPTLVAAAAVPTAAPVATPDPAPPPPAVEPLPPPRAEETVPAQVAPVTAPTPAPAPTAPEPPGRAYTRHAQGYWVQLGAFRERSGAEAFQRRVATELDWLAPLLTIFNETAAHRLQAGPFVSKGEAGNASRRIRDALQLVPVIVERR